VLRCDNGETVAATYCVMATGCLSTTKKPDFPGLSTFQGQWFHTGQWPHNPVDLSGKTVAVLGTGSSAIQVIPQIARQAERLYVLQRTPNYSMPAQNRLLPEEEVRGALRDFRKRRRLCEESESGVPLAPPTLATFQVPPEQRSARYEEGWRRGGISALSSAFTDFFTDEEANRLAQDFARAKIRQIVRDPTVAELLCPRHDIGTKRTCTDIGYFETYNRDNVELVNVRDDPIREITPTGIRLSDRIIDVAAIVFAIGFDAMTGALFEIAIRGVNGQHLQDKWKHGPLSLLGLQTAGFPNLFMITGPGSPSVLSNMVVSIEQHVDWVADCLTYLRDQGADRIEATVEAEEQWMRHVAELAAGTLYPRANSWYVGANIPGKPRVFMPYVAGCGQYRRACEDIVNRGYAGFALGRTGTTHEAEAHT
jgi:cyclohexanone monooxygenase